MEFNSKKGTTFMNMEVNLNKPIETKWYNKFPFSFKPHYMKVYGIHKDQGKKLVLVVSLP